MLHPLLPPEPSSPLLTQFLRASGISSRLGATTPTELLTQVATAFARLPFENLTKILKEANAGRPAEARRFPQEVLADHWAWGTGGTCFSLTATLLHLVRALGFVAEPILADRHYGPDTHSGLLVWLEGKPHLLDPGFLIVRPLALPRSVETIVDTPFNQLVLAPRQDGARVDLHTRQDSQTTYRLTFKTSPVDAGQFLRAWDTSFDAEMMRYPVLSRVVGARQLYLQKRHFLSRGRQGSERCELDGEGLVEEIVRRFEIAPSVVREALALLHRKGEAHGAASA